MSYHQRIMNIPGDSNDYGYKNGHRDARHAAAEIANEAEAELAMVRADLELMRVERDEARAQADGLRDALQAMFDEYEGVYDMAVPTKHQSEGAKRAEALARAALAAMPKEADRE